MRAFLILTVFLSILAGCNPPHYDLSEPIYLVPEKSFWQGCESHPSGYMACMAERKDIIYRGTQDWLRHFDEATRPVAIIVYPEEVIPEGAKNEPIKLRVGNDDLCSGDNWEACYAWVIGSHPRIIFRKAEYISARNTAHEFGHAIWNMRHVEDRLSIMTACDPFYYVTPLDLDGMCAENGTCPPYEDEWCVGTFNLSCYCPSDSPEDGMAEFGAGEIVCR